MLLLFILGAIWGSAFAVARFVIEHGVSPVSYAFLLVAFPALLLVIYCLYRGKLQKLFAVKPQHFLIAGLFGIVLPNTNKYWLAAHLPSGVLAVVVGTTPFFIYPLALLFREEVFRSRRLLGIICGGAGIILLALRHGMGGFNLNSWLLISLFAPFCYAFCAVYVAKFVGSEADTVLLTTGTLIAAAIFLLLWFLVSAHSFNIQHLLQPKVASWIGIEMILVTCGYLLLFKILQDFGSVNYSAVDGIGGVIGLFWGSMIFHESLSWYIGAAILCIVSGVLLLKPAKKV